MTSRQHDIPWDENICLSKTMKQIKQTSYYKNLTPLGKLNPSGKYHYGNKSTMRKANLCKALANPLAYHAKNKKAHRDRVRESRKGLCVPKARKYKKGRKTGCTDKRWPQKGYTTTGRRCCYKKKQSDKVIKKRKKEREKRKKEIKKKIAD